MDGVSIIPSEIEKDKYHMISLICRIYKTKQAWGEKEKKGKPRNRLLTIENKLYQTKKTN